MVRVSGRQGLQNAFVECDVPFLVAKDPIKMYESWLSAFVAPCEFPVLEAYFFDLAMVNSPPEFGHETEIEVAVVFVSRPVNEVEVADDQPSRTRRRF